MTKRDGNQWTAAIVAAVLFMLLIPLSDGCRRGEPSGGSNAAPGTDVVTTTEQFRRSAEARGIAVKQVDAVSASHIDATLADGKTLRISWLDMGRNTPEATRDLNRKMTMLTTILDSEQGRDARHLDATEANSVMVLDDGTHPALPPADSPSAPMLHTVKEGEDLFSIALWWNVSLRDLRAANGMTSDEVRVGDTIRIPLNRATGQTDE